MWSGRRRFGCWLDCAAFASKRAFVVAAECWAGGVGGVPGLRLDHYPSWPFLIAAVAAALAVAVRYMQLDRGSNPPGTWLKLLVAWLAVVVVAALGLVFTRNGQRIAPNEGLLLVYTDIMVSLLVISVPLARATRRLTVSGLRQILAPLRSPPCLAVADPSRSSSS